MGILRVYLALCVIASHTTYFLPWQMHYGNQAVQIFYIISGFYMAIVLSSPRYSTLRDFYTSRLLRIYPAYWIVLLVTILFCLCTGLAFHQWHLLKAYANNPWAHNGTMGIILASFSNITLLGQDWVMFLSHDLGHSLHFTENFKTDAFPLWGYLLVPQCWSVGVELTFYAFVPYLNKLRSRWLIAIALLSLAGRLYGYLHLGLAHDPWDVRFFPFEISMFILGMLGYRLYVSITTRYPSQRFRSVSNYSYIACGIMLVFLLSLHARIVHYFVHLSRTEMGILLTSPLWILLIPLLFFIFGKQKLDRTIGEISYPIYLVQDIAIIIVRTLFNYFGLTWNVGLSSALVSMILAIFLYRLFLVPIDKKRHLLAHINSHHVL